MSRTRFRILFLSENDALAMTADCSRAKAYLKIRCEAKQADGASCGVCSGKGILK